MIRFNPFLPKNLLRLFLAMAALALVLRLAGPSIVSADRVEREIEAKLAAWTGARLSFSGTPSFTFWPHPQMGFSHARLRNPETDGSEGPDLLTVERISVDFSLVGSLFGKPDLGDIELVRPTIHFRRDESGTLNWHQGTAIAGTGRELGDTDKTPDFGTLVLRDATIVVDDLTRAAHYRIANVEGTIEWPTIHSDLDIGLRGIINGQVANWRFSADEPATLLDGQNASVRTSLVSDLLKFDFEGLANLSRDAFATGQIRLETPSFGNLLAWRGTNFPPARQLGQVVLEGTVKTNGYAVHIGNLQLAIQDSNATGVLDISLPPRASPRIGGTLAFDRIDLLSMIGAYAPSAVGDDRQASRFAAAAVDAINLDLRLSAREAALEPLMLTDLAAGIRAADGQASLDIGEGTLLGGSINGRVAVSGREIMQGGEVRLSLRNVDLGEIINLSGLSGPVPTGRGSAEIDFFTERLQPVDKADLTGTFKFSFDQGAITNFDHPAFERLAQGNTLFNMKDAAGGSFKFMTATVEGHVDGGIVELTRASFEAPEKTLAISGTVPYRNGNVALAGSLVERALPDTAVVKPAINFLVGGSWPTPVISPMALLLQNPAN